MWNNNYNCWTNNNESSAIHYVLSQSMKCILKFLKKKILVKRIY